MTENVYAPPQSPIRSTIRRLEWWNRGLMALVALICTFPLLGGLVLFAGYYDLASRPGVSFQADAGDWVRYVSIAVACLAMLAAGVILLFRKKIAIYFFLPMVAVAIHGLSKGIEAKQLVSCFVLAVCVIYVALLRRRGYLH